MITCFFLTGEIRYFLVKPMLLDGENIVFEV